MTKKVAKKKATKKSEPKAKKPTVASVAAQLEEVRNSAMAADTRSKMATHICASFQETQDVCAQDLLELKAWVEDHKSTSVTHTIALACLAVLGVAALVIAL